MNVAVANKMQFNSPTVSIGGSASENVLRQFMITMREPGTAQIYERAPTKDVYSEYAGQEYSPVSNQVAKKAASMFVN